jgi:hypothetical protein
LAKARSLVREARTQLEASSFPKETRASRIK